jgi:hypothetical protein
MPVDTGKWAWEHHGSCVVVKRDGEQVADMHDGVDALAQFIVDALNAAEDRAALVAERQAADAAATKKAHEHGAGELWSNRVDRAMQDVE